MCDERGIHTYEERDRQAFVGASSRWNVYDGGGQKKGIIDLTRHVTQWACSPAIQINSGQNCSNADSAGMPFVGAQSALSGVAGPQAVGDPQGLFGPRGSLRPYRSEGCVQAWR